MKKILLLLGAFCLLSLDSFSQQNSSLENQIILKEAELARAVNNSRQVNNSIQSDLLKLYIEYKSELETQLKSNTDKVLYEKKKEELELIIKKIENYK